MSESEGNESPILVLTGASDAMEIRILTLLFKNTGMALAEELRIGGDDVRDNARRLVLEMAEMSQQLVMEAPPIRPVPSHAMLSADWTQSASSRKQHDFVPSRIKSYNGPKRNFRRRHLSPGR